MHLRTGEIVCILGHAHALSEAFKDCSTSLPFS